MHGGEGLHGEVTDLTVHESAATRAPAARARAGGRIRALGAKTPK